MDTTLVQAIDAHLAWTQTFRTAIEKGEVSPMIRKAGYDDLCEFGKWLYSLPDAVKHTPAYRKTKDRHYTFHVEAAVIAALLENNQYAVAREALAGDFAQASVDLVGAMEDWRASL